MDKLIVDKLLVFSDKILHVCNCCAVTHGGRLAPLELSDTQFFIIHPPPQKKTNKEKMIAVLNFSASSNKNLSEEERAKEKENGIGKYLVSGEVCVLNMV